MFYYYLSGKNGEFLQKGFVYSANHLSSTLKESQDQYKYNIKKFGEYIYNNINEIQKGDLIIFENMELEIF